jgi:hypothetical protein
VDEEFRDWAEKRDMEFRDWTERRERKFSEWTEKREREFSERTEKRDREQRDFLDALLERHVSITQQMIDAMNKGFDQLQAEIADQRAQIQANTQAVLRLLDRFGPA